MICHIGESSISGHFVVYCKNKKDKRWYFYNDRTVSPCKDPNEDPKRKPYILFYQSLTL